MKLLNLGCGKRIHSDWINIDFVSTRKEIIQHNLLDGIPLTDKSVDVVYHSHVLEHFSKKDGEKFLTECYRVLNEGGIIRVVVPDLEVIAIEYLKNLNLALEGDKIAKENYEWIKLELMDQMVREKSGGEMIKYLQRDNLKNEEYVFTRIGLEGKKIRNDSLKRKKITSKRTVPQKKINLLFRKILTKLSKNKRNEKKALQIGNFRLGGEIHQWMYDRYSLAELLKEVGFKEIAITNAFESRIKHWKSFELDFINGEVIKPDSLFIEARKI